MPLFEEKELNIDKIHLFRSEVCLILSSFILLLFEFYQKWILNFFSSSSFSWNHKVHLRQRFCCNNKKATTTRSTIPGIWDSCERCHNCQKWKTNLTIWGDVHSRANIIFCGFKFPRMQSINSLVFLSISKQDSKEKFSTSSWLFTSTSSPLIVGYR